MDDGTAGKKLGMKRAARAADPAWMAEAWHALRRAARELDTLTVDDVHSRIGDHVSTHELRALGPVMVAGKRDNTIEATSTFVKCNRRSRHKADLRVWRSLIR